MKGWSEVKDFFALTKKDRVGLWVMAIVILVLFILPDLPQAEKWLAKADTDTAWMAEWRNFLDTMGQVPEKNSSQALLSSAEADPPSPALLFPFDPNTLTEDGWRKLGLRPKTIQTILNYRNKGGVFRKPEDLGRVYGLFPDEYERLKPFIDIQAPAAVKDSFNRKNAAPALARKPAIHNIDINVADSISWEALPGIGPKLAQRVIRFRDALGGFYSIEQVSETFGLPDSTFQKIKPYLVNSTLSFKRININEVSAADLARHPYFSRSVASRIVAYREQHGSFSNVEDLRKIIGVTDSMFLKWRAYLNTGL